MVANRSIDEKRYDNFLSKMVLIIRAQKSYASLGLFKDGIIANIFLFSCDVCQANSAEILPLGTFSETEILSYVDV